MKRIIIAVSIAFLVAFPGYTLGASPMVERHIFMPDGEEEKGPEAAVQEKSPEVERLERELLFTGVIIGPSEKRAMITEKASRRGKSAESEKKSPLLREGDEIGGMTIKEIGRNYLVLTGQGKDVRLNLYQENKDRPAPPPEPKAAEAPPVPTQPAGAESGQPGAAERQGESAEPTKPGAQAQTARTTPPATTPSQVAPNQSSPSDANPFAEALKRAAQGRRENRKTAVNPFLDAIRRAQEDQGR